MARRNQIRTLIADDSASRTNCQCNCKHKNKHTTLEDSSDSEYENITADEIRKERDKILPKRVILDIGGQKFATSPATLTAFADTKLGRLSKSDPSYDSHKGEFFFDRNAKIFANILDLYRTGELHFPHDLCGPFIQNELDFWGISESVIAPCCLKTFKEYEEEQHTLQRLETMFGGNQLLEDKGLHCMRDGCKKWMRRIWLFLEVPASSYTAKIWAYVYLLLLAVSITMICMETHPNFRIPFKDKNHCMPHPDPTSNSTNTTTKNQMSTKFIDSTNHKMQMFMLTRPLPALQIIDELCNYVFGIELIIRFIVWPKKHKFFLSFFNVIDILAVVPIVILTVISRFSPCFWKESGLLSIYLTMSFVCVFRSVRILKLVKHSRGLQIMYLAIKASIREISLLLLLIMIGTLIFSTMIYYAEFSHKDNFMNIPIGFWWSIVTMTTVGYGDMTPKTGLGYVVGSLCALTGMLITGLPIPVIANSFSLYYSYAKLKDKLDLRKKGLCGKSSTKSKKYIHNKSNHGYNSRHGNHNQWTTTRCNGTAYQILDSTSIKSLNHL